MTQTTLQKRVQSLGKKYVKDNFHFASVSVSTNNYDGKNIKTEFKASIYLKNATNEGITVQSNKPSELLSKLENQLKVFKPTTKRFEMFQC